MNGSTGNCTKEWTNVWMIDCANDNFMDDWLKNSHSLDVIWQDMSKISGLLYESPKAKKETYCTWNQVKPSKKSYFGPFFEKFCSLCSFHHQIYARHISGRTITGLPGVTLVKIA